MIGLRRWLTRVGEWMTGGRIDRDLTDEVRAHLDHLTDAYIARGLAPDAARRAAIRDFGPVEAAKESVRDVRGFRRAEAWLQDLRFAWRGLRRTPAFTATAVLTLAVGIGATTAIFSVIDAVMLKPLPFQAPDRLVSLWESIGPDPAPTAAGPRYIGVPGRQAVSFANYVDYRELRGFAGLAAYTDAAMTLTGAGAPEQLTGEAVTPDYFAVLGVHAAAGRLLDATDDGAKVVVISDALWRRRFAADPAVIGRTARLDGTPWQIVGITPPAFRAVTTFESAGTPVDFWQLAEIPPELRSDEGRGDHQFHAVGRLAEGVTLDAAVADLDALSLRLADTFPKTNGRVRAAIGPLARDLVRGTRRSLLAVFTMMGLILLIACVNVANLIIVRSVGRKREIAVRLALGADRRRVRRALVAESAVLAALAGTAGLAVAAGAQRVLLALAPANTPRLDEVAFDIRLLGVAVAVTAATAFVFGMFPAWQASQERPADALRTTERTGATTAVLRWRLGLMALEVGLSAVLLVGAGLTWRSLNAMNHVPIGFRTNGVLALNIALPPSRYPDATARYQFFEALLPQLAALPGVDAAAVANRLPLRGGWSSGFRIVGSGDDMHEADFQAVTPGYFDVLAIPLVNGRRLEARDRADAPPVAVVSQAFARVLLGGENAIGRRIRRGPQAPEIEIVGVVQDVRRDGQLESLAPQVYLPAAQTGSYPVRLGDVAVHTSGDPRALVPALQDAIWSIDKDQPITAVRTLDEILFARGSGHRFRALLFGLCGGLALALALVGVYGVVSYAVAERRQEIGVRLALGADQGRIMRWLLGRTAAVLVAATAAGLLIARLASSTIAALLFDVTTADALTYLGTAAGLLLVAILAAFLAVRRVARISPALTLRAG